METPWRLVLAARTCGSWRAARPSQLCCLLVSEQVRAPLLGENNLRNMWRRFSASQGAMKLLGSACGTLWHDVVGALSGRAYGTLWWWVSLLHVVARCVNILINISNVSARPLGWDRIVGPNRGPGEIVSNVFQFVYTTSKLLSARVVAELLICHPLTHPCPGNRHVVLYIVSVMHLLPKVLFFTAHSLAVIHRFDWRRAGLGCVWIAARLHIVSTTSRKPTERPSEM
jgi:hypothetical protein